MKDFICQNCGKLCNNIKGGDCTIEKKGETKHVCVECAESLAQEGWTELMRARSLKI